ncbi:hypothetical protein KJ819_00175 [Patescibacteria group bacterium]|nr:hypothetical protein [Patescibacteria group bacterium]MBU1500615.1 hypothetical protein [Patescibacteria group bacterium]MBU2080542.1 hypothetical protein [Patescibacteria group bacterium]MBU2123653.1 hypothetical protein [Patescibacteria group bacterium]MBU2194509.1 hypothetical protein [Patescibacteria group bacterium]
MFSLADLLKNHPIPGLKEAAIRGECAEAVSLVLGVSIPTKKIAYDAGVLTLSLAPVVKSAALLKQDKIKTALQERGIDLKEIR